MTENGENKTEYQNAHNFDVVVAGAGHAGVEAALATARRGLKTALFTLSLDAIANLPCNPSIGGSGKGHIVFEIDALGGEMGYQADKVTLQSRTLNTGKGAAVRSKRVQADRRKYSENVKAALEAEPNLQIVQAEVSEIHTDDGKICGITARPGGEFACRALIISTGTYLGAETHVGDVNTRQGPDFMTGAEHLTSSLISHGISMMRFKTGTPPRIHRRSIDFDALDIQEGEDYITPFSVRTDEDNLNSIVQVPCHIVYTNEKTHEIIRNNLHLSPLYSGKIHGTGPRYCPSIEDKVVRFSDKERHQLFAEPMGQTTEEIYLQGFSSSLPAEVQFQMLHSLKGFEHAEIMRYAYAIEYDCIDPTQLYPTLEFKEIEGLYGAGQFNGTSGYEEAAAQGLVAGLNAAAKLLSEKPIILPRYSSYTGTLIDDLVTKGTKEPYRIMTSRSEYRLLLRQDNTDRRLEEYAKRGGLVSAERFEAYLEKKTRCDAEIERVNHLNISPKAANPFFEKIGEVPVSSGLTLAEIIKRPSVSYEMSAELDPERTGFTHSEKANIEAEIKYEGYVRHQISAVERQKKMEEKPLPDDIDYKSIKGLRIEAAEKLEKIRPASIGQAARISGVSPADISVLTIYLQIKK